MKVLVWHWGRRGAGPIFASRLSQSLAALPGSAATLSLSASAEIMTQPDCVRCDWPEPTYDSAIGYAGQLFAEPFLRRRTVRRLQSIEPDVAVCAMPALLDGRMMQALRQTGIPYAVVVHDATAHPGEALNFRMLGQSRLLRNAAALFALTAHVEDDLRRQGFGRNGQIIAKLWHPPIYFGDMKPPFAHGGRSRLLSFGRLLPYKGLDMLADALAAFGPELPFDVRICGSGPASHGLLRLRSIPGVEVDQRWIPEAELRGLIEWSDALVLPYREASQSGVAAVAIGQGRLVVATNVGGLPEQLAGVANAVLCEPNAAAITEALKNLPRAGSLAPPENTQMSWHCMAAKMLETLERVTADYSAAAAC